MLHLLFIRSHVSKRTPTARTINRSKDLGSNNIFIVLKQDYSQLTINSLLELKVRMIRVY